MSGLAIIFFIFSSIIATGYLLADIQRPSYFTIIWMMPLAFFFITVLFIYRWNNLYFCSITGTIVILIYYARLVITPFVMAIGNYETIISEKIYSSNASYAVFLMVYETFVVFLLLTSFLQKSYGIFSEMVYPKENEMLEVEHKPGGGLCLVVGLLCIFIIGMIIFDPSIWKANFLLLIDVNQSYYAYSSSETGIGSLSMFVELMNSAFKLVQVMLPPMLLYFIARRKGYIFRNVAAFVIFISVVIVATEDRIDAIFAGIAFLYTIRDAYGKAFKGKFRQWLIIIVAAALLGLAIKSGTVSSGNNGTDFGSASSMLAAYFSGIPTVAAGIGFADSLEGLNIFHIFPDMISKIPYFTYALSLFTGIDITNSNQLFNNYISGALGRGYGQILPSIAVGYEYFGFILAPVLPALFLKLALYFERNIKMQKNIIRRNLYYWITICVAASPVISSVLLITAKLSWFLIAMGIMWVFQRKHE